MIIGNYKIMVKIKKDEKINKDEYAKNEELVLGDEASEPGEPLKEVAEDGELIEGENKKLKAEVEKMEVEDSLKSSVQDDTNNAVLLEEQKKIKFLLELAKKKGVIYAVNVAKNMKDPYLLDTLHDRLIQDGHYKEFAN